MYTPILRCRQNELLALTEVSAEAKQLCMPLLDLPAPSTNEQKAASEAFTERSIGRTKKALAGFVRVFVDSSELDPALRIGGAHPLLEAAKSIALSDVLPVPVSGLHRDAAHKKAAAIASKELADDSVCIRLDSTDISTATLTQKRITGMLSDYGLDTSRAFLLIDLKSVFQQDPTHLAKSVGHFVAQASKWQWAGVVVAGYGVPDELREAIAVREQGYLPRTEQLVYRSVATANELQNLWFGDYTTLSPAHVELDGRYMNKVMGPKALYALEDSWFVVRGGPFSTHKDGYEQYYDLAAEITALDEFCGAEFSWGDNYIQERANRIPRPGSPGTWIKACVNHHVTFTTLSHS
jgi:Beta protein